MLTVSFIVCSHNGARTLEQCLTCLLLQSSSHIIAAVEIVVVTNGCTDGSEQIVREIIRESASQSRGVRCIHFDLQKPGKSAALEKGLDIATGELLAVVDDDNYLPPDWVVRVGRYCSKLEFPGILGTASRLPDATWASVDVQIRPHLRHFAIGKQNQIDGSRLEVAWGAGCVFRRKIWLDLRERRFRFFLSGRVGARLVAGEDTEFCIAAGFLGYSAISANEVILIHDIDPSRLTKKYLLRLLHSEGVAHSVLLTYRRALQNRSTAWVQLLFFRLVLLARMMVKIAWLQCDHFVTGRWEALWRQHLARGVLVGLVAFAPRTSELLCQIRNLTSPDRAAKPPSVFQI